ncbi:MAG TPA: helix-turn-helix domain-containing protein [Ktedonobacteraceae bacterium]|nr:helix-turn-helix domain-containing protein [Ktedonobacteraceae bacterium]
MPVTTGKALLLFQEKWVLFIVYNLLQGPLGFNELSRRAVNVNSRTLSQRLDLLEQQGIVTRTVHSTIPPRTSYALTKMGTEVRPVLEAISAWGEKYMLEEAGEGNGHPPG